MQTLNDIASSLGVSLQTIYNRKADAEKRLGRKIEGTPHPTDKRKIVYDAEAVELITGHPGQAIEPVKAVEVTVETGNHCHALNQPEIGGTEFSLERFRADDVQALIFEDPNAVADQFLAVADQLVAGMEADIAAREQRLRATRTAQGKVATKAQELKLEQRLYRDRAKDLDTAQTDETRALQDAVTALQSLGKSPDPQQSNPD
jgi:AcrR family transcriptional regulator